jgi:hypothetical protein
VCPSVSICPDPFCHNPCLVAPSLPPSVRAKRPCRVVPRFSLVLCTVSFAGKTKERRSNEDVNRRELMLKLEEERKKAMELINATFAHLGSTSLLPAPSLLRPDPLRPSAGARRL